MPTRNETIFALSSGDLPSGVAIVRISGDQVDSAMKRISGVVPSARSMTYSEFKDPISGDPLDRGLCVRFPGPNSFTGEDVGEFHLHGGIAVVEGFIRSLSAMNGFRLAEAGEFTRRAFENGKLDLTEVEGIGDLIDAETEEQKKLALRQAGGSLRKLYEQWRERIVRCRALIEAELDFSDEDDVPGSVSDQVWVDVQQLCSEISNHLADDRVGEIIRDGFQVSLAGKPNAGKSSLLNVLARRDIAIVTEQAGTTRDVLEVPLDIDGMKVVLKDTAGLRETTDLVESEGIRRAKLAMNSSDLVLWLTEDEPTDKELGQVDVPIVIVQTKTDLTGEQHDWAAISISAKTGVGVEQLIDSIRNRIEINSVSESGVISRKRHRDNLRLCFEQLNRSVEMETYPIELRSEELRKAGDHIGRITGKVDVEDLLDVVFSSFCIGK
ncbi:MAG: tRNA uridine-5-carboxymethylaminomethyl(34) synthesis GTPase MnmE [Pseudomonadota bacterium]